MKWERSLELILGSGESGKVLDLARLWLAACGGTGLLKLQCAQESPRNLVKIYILMRQVWGGL